MKGFIGLDAHPEGCRAQVAQLVERVARNGPCSMLLPGPVVVLGSSGGYGLPAAATAAFRYQTPVIGVCFERPAQRARTATAGWYNIIELHRQADARGARVATLNADCFADQTKREVIAWLNRVGPPALLIYSVAAPARTDSATGETYPSALKPVGQPFTTKTLKIDTGEIAEVTLGAASEAEVADPCE